MTNVMKHTKYTTRGTEQEFTVATVQLEPASWRRRKRRLSVWV